MYDFSFQGILNQIEVWNSFGSIYIIGAGFLFGGIATYYWGMKKAVIIGLIAILCFFLFVSYQQTGLTPSLFNHFLSSFLGVVYTLVGLVLGAFLSQLLFNVNR